MKKNLVLLAGAMMALTACEKQSVDAVDAQYETQKKELTFAVEGDFGAATFTRGAMTADGKQMTDLWVLDYMGGVLVQQLHQTAEDDDFGSPSLTLDFGDHHVYFVASRGSSPTLDTDEHTVTWASTSDTFWTDYSVSVTSGTAAAHNVTLNRVATKLSVTIADEIPDGTAYVEIIPATWYYGLDYLDGSATEAQTSEPRTITIPAAKIGTTGTTLSIFGLSGTEEWTTDVTVNACDGDDNVLGTATISDAPMTANRATCYSGNLFSGASGFDLSLNVTWNDDQNGTW